MARWLVVTGVIIVVVGLAWPYLERIGLGRLPGDITIQREGSRIFLPITTCLLLTAAANLIIWIIQKLGR